MDLGVLCIKKLVFYESMLASIENAIFVMSIRTRTLKKAISKQAPFKRDCIISEAGIMDFIEVNRMAIIAAVSLVQWLQRKKPVSYNVFLIT